jgi:hypothetical protein
LASLGGPMPGRKCSENQAGLAHATPRQLSTLFAELRKLG